MNGSVYFALLVAFLGGAALKAVPQKQPHQSDDNPPKKKLTRTTTMKLIVWFCLLNGFAWVWCSYLLAYLGRTAIAENLSKVAITEIIGVVLVYAVKSLLENLSKNNQWPDKPAKQNKQDCD